MLINQLFLGLFFYLIFSLFFFIGLPFAQKVFFGKATIYLTAKFFGLILFGYLVWLLGSFKLLDYQNKTFILGFFLGAIIIGCYFGRNFFKDKLINFKNIFIVEGITIALYLLYLFLRSHNADINGTERFMDLAMMSASGKTHYFPFIDPWYAGKTVNYYYFGAYLLSLISNLSRLPYVLAYNFAIGVIFCQSAALSALLTFKLSRSKLAAILAAFLVTAAGTAFYASCQLNASLAENPTTCSYASSTRLYTPSYIINEIPSYSFTVGDLHAHLIALPFFIFNLILLFALALEKTPKKSLLILLAVSFAVSGMINSWDLITLLSIFCVLSLTKIYVLFKAKENFKAWILKPLATILGTVVLMYPFLHNYKSAVLGLGFVPTYVKFFSLHDVQWPTPFLAELGMWGVFLAGLIIYFIKHKKTWQEYVYPLSLLIVSVGIIVGVEFFFIKDIYSITNPPYFRANTTFKFGYHAWTMLSIVFASLLPFVVLKKGESKLKLEQKAVKWLLVIAVIAGVFYPYQAIEQFYYYQPPVKLTLDGSNWLQNSGDGDFEAITYINQNFKDRSVILEAVGDSYTTFSRITTYTGQITIMGWSTHEWTWRFDGTNTKNFKPGQNIETGWGPIAKIQGDVKQLYLTSNEALTKQLLNKYGIQYVYVGTLERKTYPALNEQKFYNLGTLVLQTNQSKLFKVN